MHAKTAAERAITGHDAELARRTAPAGLLHSNQTLFDIPVCWLQRPVAAPLRAPIDLAECNALFHRDRPVRLFLTTALLSQPLLACLLLARCFRLAPLTFGLDRVGALVCFLYCLFFGVALLLSKPALGFGKLLLTPRPLGVSSVPGRLCVNPARWIGRCPLRCILRFDRRLTRIGLLNASCVLSGDAVDRSAPNRPVL